MNPTIFISYSHKDRDYCQRLLDHLGAIRFIDGIKVFDDSQLSPGSRWEQILINRIDEADIVVLLITASFLGSRFCTVEEMTRALQSEKFIIPVIVKHVDLGALPVAHYQALPKDRNQNLVPVVAWGGPDQQDEAWALIARAIREAASNQARETVQFPASSNLPGPRPTISNIANEMKGLLDGVRYDIKFPDKLTANPYIDVAMRAKIDSVLADIASRGPTHLWRSQEEELGDGAFAEMEMEVNVEYESDSFISIRGTFRTLFYGAAHSGYETFVSNIDRIKGRAILLKDFFDWFSDLHAITDVVVKCVEHEKFLRSSILDESDEKKIRNEWIEHEKFFLRKTRHNSNEFDTIVMIYDPYEIGSFAEYIYEVPIPLIGLLDHIKPPIKAVLFNQ